MTFVLARFVAYQRFFRFSHYAKNLFIFLPLFFTLGIFDLRALGLTSVAFVGFSLLSSAVYVFNDIHDIAHDRLHPTKKLRPLPSGSVHVTEAWVLAGALTSVALIILTFLPWPVVWYSLGYAGLNILYSLWLKHSAIVDVTVIAIGFVLRLYVGAAVLALSVSHWVVAITFLLALFLGFAKRFDDVAVFAGSDAGTRRSLDGYTLPFLTAAVTITASVLLIAYLLYSTSAEILSRPYGEHIYLTTLFVFIGVFRYLQRLFVAQTNEPPTEVFFKDRVIQLTLIGWALSLIVMLY